MNKKVLFSPVGGTDPISQYNGYEGALMQIARYWKPDTIYLYMSKEILDNQAKDGGDGRYIYCLHKLEEKIGCSFNIIIISKSNLVDVQLFDPIYRDFENELAKIENNEEMDATDELLLNISSGTPAMKSALLVLATMLDLPCICIQVDTPDKKMNEHKHEGDWKLEDFWECDMDNDLDSSDRTHSEELPSLKLLKYEENIKRFVNEYDYNAAFKLAESLTKDEVAPYINKLKIAKARRDLNFSEVNNLVQDEKNRELYIPYETDDDYRTLYEYILNLQAKVGRKEYADFIRGISPIFVPIFARILEKIDISFKLEDYANNSGGKWIWDSDALLGTKYKSILDEEYHPFFSGTYVQADHLCKLVDNSIDDDSVDDDSVKKQCVDDLRMVEREARNIAAHNMVYIDDQWITDKTGFDCQTIISKIHEACGYTNMNMKLCKWDSYQTMNKDIIAAISNV